MSWPGDTLAGIYLFLFGFGLIFSVGSLLLGAIGGHFHLPGSGHVEHSVHVGHHGHAGGHLHGGFGHGAGHGHTAAHGHAGHTDGAADLRAPSPLNVSTAMIFLTWFGATGYILHVYYGAVAAWSLLAATLAGGVGALIVYTFLARVLWRGQTQLDPANYQIGGTPARVTSSIRAGGAGEIVYTLDGKRRVDGACSADGTPIPAGSAVAILRYERGLAYVCPLDPARDDPFGVEEATTAPEPGGSGRR
jgi:hypothetical protein